MLNATSALGVFAQVKCGASLRPPLQWSNNVTHVIFTHPYILTLNDEFITVHRYTIHLGRLLIIRMYSSSAAAQCLMITMHTWTYNCIFLLTCLYLFFFHQKLFVPIQFQVPLRSLTS